MKEQQATQIQKTEMQEHTSYPGKTPTELADLTNRLADLVECDPQPLDESRKEVAAAQEPAAQEQLATKTKEERLERLRQAERSHNAAASRGNNSPYSKDYPELCCAVDHGSGCESWIYHGTACPGAGKCPTELYERELKSQEAEEIANGWVEAQTVFAAQDAAALTESETKAEPAAQTQPATNTKPEDKEDYWADLTKGCVLVDGTLTYFLSPSPLSGRTQQEVDAYLKVMADEPAGYEPDNAPSDTSEEARHEEIANWLDSIAIVQSFYAVNWPYYDHEQGARLTMGCMFAGDDVAAMEQTMNTETKAEREARLIAAGAPCAAELIELQALRQTASPTEVQEMEDRLAETYGVWFTEKPKTCYERWKDKQVRRGKRA